MAADRDDSRKTSRQMEQRRARHAAEGAALTDTEAKAKLIVAVWGPAVLEEMRKWRAQHPNRPFTAKKARG